MLDSLSVAEFELIIGDLRVTEYIAAAGLAILLYDHLLTLDDEVRYIWKARWTIPKAMFLFLRYTVPVIIILSVLQTSGLSVVNLDHTSSCKGVIAVSTVSGLVAMAFSHVFAMVRLWFLCDYESWLVRGTLLCFVLTQMASVVCASIALHDIMSTMLWAPQVNSCAFSRRLELGKLWAPGVFFDMVVLISITANVLSRPREASKGLLKCLANDGYFYFFIILLFRLTIMVMALTSRSTLIFVGIRLIWCAITATTTRFVLRLRRQVLSLIDDNTEMELKPGCCDTGRRTEIRIATTTSIDSATP